MNRDKFFGTVKPNSMTRYDRISCLYDSMEFVRNNCIVGDYVECGVWRGGNILGMMEYLHYHGDVEDRVWLYDTFTGMTAPESVDVDFSGEAASSLMDRPNVRCEASLDYVKRVLSKSLFPKENIKYVVGDVCTTLLDPVNIPDRIALLRLDTDWYASTKMELEVLWDRLEVGAPCIIDDYGHWSGSKKAVDEFFVDRPHEIEKIDYTAIRIFKKY